MASPAAAATSGAAQQAARDVVVFRVADITCGLDVRQIQEINKITAHTAVHRAPGFVRGLVNMRGQIITLVDVRSRLGLPQGDLQGATPAIIVPVGSELVGLLVDEVDDVVEVEEGNVRPPPANLHGVEGRYFTSVLQTAGGLVAMLDKERIASNDGDASAGSTASLKV
jgi:purine-binding chemotaxis protein CheW